jgi:hypothetical protein
MPFAAIAADRPGTLKSRIIEPFAETLRPAFGISLAGGFPLVED